MGGPSGGGGSTNTTYATNLPEYAEPYFRTLMDRGERESQRNPADFVYGADRTANTTGDSTIAAEANRNVWRRGAPDIDAARGATAQAGAVSQGLGQFQGANFQSGYTAPAPYAGAQVQGANFQSGYTAPTPYAGAQVQGGNFRSDYTAPTPYAGAQFQGANLRSDYTAPTPYTGAQFQGTNFRSDYTAPAPYTGAQFDPRMIQAASVSAQPFTGADAARYMSPYMQKVVDRQTQAAQQAFDEGQGARDQKAISSGAFGGYRNAIERGVAQRGLQTQKGDIQAAGSQAAYQQAQAQFNADQQRQLQAGTTTAGYDMAAQSANQQAGIDAQKAREMSRQFGATTGSQQQQFASTEAMRAAQATDASRMAAQNAQEASRQYGATTGSQQQQFASTEAMRAALATDASRTAAQNAQEASRQYGATTGSQQQQFASTEAMRAALATDASRAEAQKAQEMSRQYGNTTGSQQQQFASTEAMRAALATDASRAEAQKAQEMSRQFGATTGSQQQQFASTEAMRAAQATEASRVGAAGIRQQGGAMALNQAQMSASVAESSQKLEQARNAALAAQGTAQQEFAQKDLDIAYNNFLTQRDFEAQRLQQFGGLMRGVPVAANTTQQVNTSSNPMAQVAGLGSLAYGMSRMS